MRSEKVHLKAYIVREWCQEPSNFRSEGNLDNFLSSNKTPGLFDIDTRALTRIIRDNGTMNAMISGTPELSDEQWTRLRGYKITGAVAACAEARARANAECRMRNAESKDGITSETKSKVVLWDFGDTYSIADALISRGCAPVICKYDITAVDILTLDPAGIVLSEGPGDPAENTQIIQEITKLFGSNIPIFGVGLGHQMLALARGAGTEKLPFGHRGSNQTVEDFGTGRVFVTGQNHGYTVVPASLPASARMSHVNLSDGACEGIEYSDVPAFSVQFSPTEELFNKFISQLSSKPDASPTQRAVSGDDGQRSGADVRLQANEAKHSLGGLNAAE